MTIAINTALWRNEAKREGKEFQIEKFLAEAAKAGYEAVEMGGLEKTTKGPEHLLDLLEQHGLKLCSYSAPVTVIPYEPNIEKYRQDMQNAKALGVDLLMVCGGFLPNNRRNTYPSDYDGFAESLRAAIDHAGSLGLRYAYHPHRGCIVETIAETQMIVDRVPDLQICCDIAHLEASGEDAMGFIQTFSERIIHTHIKDYDGEKYCFAELGEGNTRLNPAECVRLLLEKDYKGPFCVELDGGQSGRPASESAKICFDYLSEALAKAGR